MPAGDVFEGFIEYTLYGQSFKLKVAVQAEATGPENGAAADAAEAVALDCVPSLEGILAAQCNIGCVYLRRILPTFGVPGLWVLETVEGDTGGQLETLNTTAILRIATELSPAKHNAMWQVSGLLEDSWDTGRLTNGFLTGVGDDMRTAIVTEWNDSKGNGYRFGVVSRILNGAPRPAPVFGKAMGSTWNVAARSRRTRTTPFTGSNAVLP